MTSKSQSPTVTDMMKCPECDKWTLVKETRRAEGYTYRRYECANLHRFTTNEVIVPSNKKANPKQLLAALRLAAKTPAV